MIPGVLTGGNDMKKLNGKWSKSAHKIPLDILNSDEPTAKHRGALTGANRTDPESDPSGRTTDAPDAPAGDSVKYLAETRVAGKEPGTSRWGGSLGRVKMRRKRGRMHASCMKVSVMRERRKSKSCVIWE